MKKYNIVIGSIIGIFLLSLFGCSVFSEELKRETMEDIQKSLFKDDNFRRFQWEEEVSFGKDVVGLLYFTSEKVNQEDVLVANLRLTNFSNKEIDYTITIKLFDVNKNLLETTSYAVQKPLLPLEEKKVSLRLYLSLRQRKAIRYYSLNYIEEVVN